ncbi:MAG: Glycogen accumulation regulator GarA [Chloroflexi bacterium ADurb.Bin222]|nr:MAG: Glycogen accumulation regulator GarA [Chloroflexi bacterium ADurb.Bin222]
MKGLMRLESWIEQIVEEPFIRLFNGQLLPQEVARRLVRAMEDGEQLTADGQVATPGGYRVTLHPAALENLRQTHPNIEADLSQGLADLITRMNIRVTHPPEVVVSVDATLPLRGVHITALQTTPPLEQTRELDFERLQAQSKQALEGPQRAYLIISGQRIFDLDVPMIHIGRAFDNELILEDRRVSRYHAQLRLRYGRYVLQDLGSTGGTSVNGYPVQELALRPGDVLSLGGLEVIYVEGPCPDPPAQQGDTRPKASEERPHG